MSDEEDFIFDEEELEEYMSDGDEIHEEDTTPEEEIREHMDFSTVVVAENLPKVPAAKFEKLKAFIINKAFNKAGSIVHDKLVVPQNKDGSTKGIAIIEYEDREAVTKAIAFNKNKIRFTAVDLKVRHFDEVHRIVRPPKSSQNKLPQTVEEYKPYIDACNASHHKLRSWLSDPQVRDQYAIRYAKETEIFWCGRNAEIELEYGAEVEKADNMTLTEMSVQWSPRGSYLGSFHPQGIALWGGAKVSRETKTGDRVDGWAKIKRFKHLGVTNIAFSPKEKFLVTSNVRSAQRATVQFFDVFSGDLKRSFQVQASEEQSMEALAHLFRPDSNDSGQNAPIFKWSHSERYFARKTSNNGGLLSVYETQHFKLLGRKSIQAKGISTFEWSPGAFDAKDNMDNIVAYFTPEENNTAACLTVQEIPSRRILRQKPIFNSSSCRLYWQNNGDYLCAQVTRHSRTGRTEFTNFELCRLRGTNYPMEALEIREPVADFAWEPFGGYLFKNTGNRFCVIHGDGPSKTVSFYTMHRPGKNKLETNKLTLLFQLQKQNVNKICWSPNGRHVVLQGNIQLLFIDVDQKEVLASPEHPHCNKIEWSPSGQYLVTAEEFDTKHGSSIEKKFRFWSFQGKPLRDEKRSKFMSFSWRPRPPLTLVMKQVSKPGDTKQSMQSVIDQLHITRQEYIREDTQRERREDQIRAEEKLSKRDEFVKLIEQADIDIRAEYKAQGLPYPLDTPADCAINVVRMEEFIEETREPVRWSTR